MSIISNRQQRIAGVDYAADQLITTLSPADEATWIGSGWGRPAMPPAPINLFLVQVTQAQYTALGANASPNVAYAIVG